MFALHKEMSTECSNILFLGDGNVKVVKTGNGIWKKKRWLTSKTRLPLLSG